MKIIAFTLLIFTFLSCGSGTKKEECALKTPVDKQATKETRDLYNRLFSLLDKGIMLGHQDDLAYGKNWYKEDGRSDVKDVTGDYPAIIGWELGHIEIGADYNLDSIYFSDMKRYAQEAHRRGSINTFSWHGDNIITGGTAWDCKQDNVVKSVLPQGENHTKYLTWLDRVADFFTELKDDEGKLIPVVFRMYHEHTGDWFWWCAKQCTPEEYKQLWIMTYDYLTKAKNVHNLIYCYSPSTVATTEQYLERYPGDEYADILAFDAYCHNDSYAESMETNLKIVTDYATKSSKIPTIGETGYERIPDPLFFTKTVYPIISKYKISWVLFWRNAWEKSDHYYLPFVGHPAAEDFKTFVELPNILMTSDLK